MTINAESFWSNPDARKICVTPSGRVIVVCRGRRWWSWTKLIELNSSGLVIRCLGRILLIHPTGVDVDESSKRIAIAYGGILGGPLYGYGGVLIMKDTLVGSIVANAIVIWRLFRLFVLLCQVFLKTLQINRDTTLKESWMLSNAIAEANRRLKFLPEKKYLGDVWSWPTAVKFVSARAGDYSTKKLLVMTSKSIYIEEPNSDSRVFYKLRDNMMNCVHISEHYGAIKGSSDSFVITEGHLHVPDMLLPGIGLGAIWLWDLTKDELTLLRGFLAAPAACVTIELSGELCLCLVAVDDSGDIRSWIEFGSPPREKQRINGLVKPSQVTQGEGGQLLFVDAEGLKSVPLPRN